MSDLASTRIQIRLKAFSRAFPFFLKVFLLLPEASRLYRIQRHEGLLLLLLPYRRADSHDLWGRHIGYKTIFLLHLSLLQSTSWVEVTGDSTESNILTSF